jgi:hypothetical protein
MRELEVPFLRRWIMWGAVRWGALTEPDGRKGWWKESGRVGLVTIAAVPIVTPAAAVILANLPATFSNYSSGCPSESPTPFGDVRASQPNE